MASSEALGTNYLVGQEEDDPHPNSNHHHSSSNLHHRDSLFHHKVNNSSLSDKLLNLNRANLDRKGHNQGRHREDQFKTVHPQETTKVSVIHNLAYLKHNLKDSVMSNKTNQYRTKYNQYNPNQDVRQDYFLDS